MQQEHTYWADDDTRDVWPSEAEIEAERLQAQLRVEELDALVVDVPDDPRVVREARQCESQQMGDELDSRFSAYCRGDVGAYIAATPDVHAAALTQAGRLASVRAALLVGVRRLAAHIESETPARVSMVTGRVRRAIADLAGRLHGLVHTCLLAARVSTAQAVAVASSNAAASPSAP